MISKMCFRPGCVQAIGTDELRLFHHFGFDRLDRLDARIALRFCSNLCLSRFSLEYLDGTAILQFIKTSYCRWLAVERGLKTAKVKRLHYSPGRKVGIDFAIPTRGESGCSEAIITLGLDSAAAAGQFLSANPNDYLSLIYFLLSLPIPIEPIEL